MSRGAVEAHCWTYPGMECGVHGAAGDTLSNFAFFLTQNLLWKLMVFMSGAALFFFFSLISIKHTLLMRLLSYLHYHLSSSPT